MIERTESAAARRARLRQQAAQRARERREGGAATLPSPDSLATPENVGYDDRAVTFRDQLIHEGITLEATSVNQLSICTCGHTAPWHNSFFSYCGYPGCVCNAGSYPVPRKDGIA